MFDFSGVHNGQDVTAQYGFNIVTGQPVGGVLPVEFWTERKKGKRLDNSGEPVWNDIEMCKIYVPGTPVSVTVKAVDEKVKRDFGQQYQAWLLNKTQKMPGMPIEQWPMVQGDEVIELKSHGFYTVESLAQTGEHQAGMMGQWGLNLREKAKAYLQALKDTAALAKKAEELAAAKAEQDALMAEIENLKQMVRDIQQGKKKKEG